MKETLLSYIILSTGFARTGLNPFTAKENEIQRVKCLISVYTTKYEFSPTTKGPLSQRATHSFPRS